MFRTGLINVFKRHINTPVTVRTGLINGFKSHQSTWSRWFSTLSDDERNQQIVFFDLETAVPTKPGDPFAIVEFGSILVCPKKIVELDSFSTLVRPTDLSLISTLSKRKNGITREAVLSAPTFSEISDRVYDILHEIGQYPPEPKATIDTYPLLTQKFGKRAGDMKLATLAKYLCLGDQSHRSLEDCRMNLEVVKKCATVLFLKSSVPPEIPTDRESSASFSPSPKTDPSLSSLEATAEEEAFLGVDQVSVTSISAAPLYPGSLRVKLFHNDGPLRLCCYSLRVRFGVSRKYLDHAGRPRLNIVVDVPPDLCKVLDASNDIARISSIDSGTSSGWRPTVIRKEGYANFPTARLQISSDWNRDDASCGTQVYRKGEPLETIQRLDFSSNDFETLESLLLPGTLVDAFFSLEPYDYLQMAGIRLTARKLVIHLKK